MMSDQAPSFEELPQPSLSKKERKKLKKLRKRLANFQTDKVRSGLLILDEWVEYQRLSQQTGSDATSPSKTNDNDSKVVSPGPSIRHRKGKGGLKVEGVHHRDLLAWLLIHQVFGDVVESKSTEEDVSTSQEDKNRLSSRKRMLEERTCSSTLMNSSIPSWASIHNPACVRQVVVLELQFQKPDSMRRCYLQFQSFLADQSSTASIRSYLHLPTKWFQGNHPKSMSDCLLCFPRTPHHEHQKAHKIGTSNSSNTQPNGKDTALLMEAKTKLSKMVMSLQEQIKEGYPMGIGNPNSNHDDVVPLLNTRPLSSEKSIVPSLLQMKAAVMLMKKEGIRVKDQIAADSQRYLSTMEAVALNGAEPRVFGMDCEMVLTSVGSELARLTLVELVAVNDDYTVETITVMDVLVKPYNTIVDYLTPYSGITSAMMEKTTLRIEQIQMALCNLLTTSDVLVGHSLENDLKAAHYLHPNVVDTALLFRPPKNKRRKLSLKHLAGSLLQKKIQSGSHCSEEDAVVALSLAVKRALLGDTFRVGIGCEQESILETIATETSTTVCGPTNWLSDVVLHHQTSTQVIDASSVDKMEKAMVSSMKNAKMFYANCDYCDRPEKETEEKTVQLLHNLLTSGVTTSGNTVVLIAMQAGFQEAKDLSRKKKVHQTPRSTFRWTVEQDREWEQSICNARDGYAFWIG